MLLLFIKINYRAINDDQFIKINNSVQDHIKKFENEGKQKIIKLIFSYDSSIELEAPIQKIFRHIYLKRTVQKLLTIKLFMNS